MGIITSAKAGKNLQDAYANEAKADEICEELQAASVQCVAIRSRSYLFYSLLAKLDSYLYPLNEEMKRIISTEGTDYSKYSERSRKSIAAVVSNIASIKTVLDTTILTEAGDITAESGELVEKCSRNYHNSGVGFAVLLPAMRCWIYELLIYCYSMDARVIYHRHREHVQK